MYEIKARTDDAGNVTIAAIRGTELVGFLLGRIVEGRPVVLSDNLPPDAKQECQLLFALIGQGTQKRSETDNNRVQQTIDNVADEDFYFYS